MRTELEPRGFPASGHETREYAGKACPRDVNAIANKKKADAMRRPCMSGARTWTRTKDPQINRRVPLPRETMTWLASIYTNRNFRPRGIKGLHFHLHGNRTPLIGTPCRQNCGA